LGVLFFLSSGLFLGWSLGANDAANVFGTAVGTRMIRFRSAAIICSIALVLGATISGSGASHTLGSLGKVNALAGAFTVALSAALTVFWMTRLKLPVSTSQAVVGAIIGWNFYSHSITNTGSLTKIVGSWVICPILSAAFAMVLYVSIKTFIIKTKIHLLHVDNLTRVGLILVGAFGSYSLGANNIANVMGVFVPSNPFNDLQMGNYLTITGTQQLFFIGALAIAVGVFTYSERVMKTVGSGIMSLSPLSAFIVVLAQALVLFLFASEGLERILYGMGLPTIPLVPVSSSQAVVGAVIGIGLLKKGSGIRYKVLGEISIGWVSSPIIAGIVTFVALFFVDNVFNNEVNKKYEYRIEPIVLEAAKLENANHKDFNEILGVTYENQTSMRNAILSNVDLNESDIHQIIEMSRIGEYLVTDKGINELEKSHWFTAEQIDALIRLKGERFCYNWQLLGELANISNEWVIREENVENKSWNRSLNEKSRRLLEVFSTVGQLHDSNNKVLEKRLGES